MLSDRPYMRGDYRPEKTSVLTWMLAAIFGAFMLELVLFSGWLDASSQLVNGLAVTIRGLTSGKVWTLLTYGLLHDTKNLFHVGLVIGGLYALGRELEPQLGARKFVGLFAVSLVVGGVFWAVVNWRHGGVLMGATAGVYGLLAFYAAHYPDREFNFLLFFVFPVTLQPKHLIFSLVAVDLVAFLFYDILGNAMPFSYAPSSHLGGMLTGWVYYRISQRAISAELDDQSENVISAMGRGPANAPTTTPPTKTPEATRTANLRLEVDRILDKINSHGFGALSADERRVLDEAKDSLTRR